MNKRARQRLIVVTLIVLAAVGGLIWATSKGATGGAYKKTVAEVAADKGLVGEQVQVSGPVLAGSWTPGARPLVFKITDQGKSDGATLKVVWKGAVPSAFGDGTVAIIKGIVDKDGSLAASSLITQCPSKYASATDALTVGDLVDKGTNFLGKPVKVSGYVGPGSVKAPGTGERFKLTAEIGGGESIPVRYTGALPSGMKDRTQVVLTGKLGSDGTFTATQVSLQKAAQ